jgi:pimeloyl-ACP methyl ester carboxylesterase
LQKCGDNKVCLEHGPELDTRGLFNQRMAVLSELKYPTTRLAKVLSGLFALALFGFVAVSTVSGFLLYQVLRPARTPTSFDLTVMMGHPMTLSFSLDDGTSREGWFFPGLRGAPTVIVAHGYRSQRADVLTLVTALQEQQFNVFLFDFAGHGTSTGVTTLGYKETGELRSAMQSISTRDDVDPKRFGLWGMDMGGYVTLEVATSDPRVAAFSVDDAYADPREMVQLQVRKSGLTALPGVALFSDIGFRLLNYSFRNEPPVSQRLGRTSGIPKLFIESDDRPELADATVKLFSQAPDPKQLVRHRQNYSDMSDDDRKMYESQIVNFFLQAIPPSSQRTH